MSLCTVVDLNSCGCGGLICLSVKTAPLLHSASFGLNVHVICISLQLDNERQDGSYRIQ